MIRKRPGDEGWAVNTRGGSLVALGFLGLIAVAIGAMTAFYHLRSARPSGTEWRRLPGPALEIRLRPDANPPPSAQPPRDIDAAMARVAARGDAAWDGGA